MTERTENRDGDVLVVLTNAPDVDTARSLARTLIERRLAACVNVLSPCHSVYRWEGGVEETPEVPMIVKTTAASYPGLEDVLRALHPYDVPEIIALPAVSGLKDYLAWVAAETGGA
ncbi:MAG: divalent cation tolerance protein CutA [Betaproteobacteria bacterium]|nr:divalent cation tolerance protein CutA [Betaproteobacteria bacterium]